MDQKVLFMADYLRGGVTMTALCARYGISRKTGYKWASRYREQGLGGLQDQSRAPMQMSGKTPYVIREAIISLRQKFRVRLGPKKLLKLLEEQFPPEELPSTTTVYNILRKAGLIKPRRRRQRVPASRQPFADVQELNEVWSVDFKGQFKMRDGRWCYPLTVMDHTSRYLLGCQGLVSTRFTLSKPVFVRLFKEFGLPSRIRSDNGVPFATVARGGLSKLSIWWLHLGILPERIEPGKPQQNGQHERMHRTLKEWVLPVPAANMVEQQQDLDRFRHFYNCERPHEALQQTVPDYVYAPSSRPYPSRLPPLHYPSYFDVKKVQPSGVVYWRGCQLYVAYLLAGEQVGLEEIADGIWDVYLGPIRLGGFDIRTMQEKSAKYLTIKV
jgi:transposase InsO family protein